MSDPIMSPSRRATMQWMLAAAASPWALAGCAPNPSGWRDAKLTAITTGGYGGDPNLIEPQTPWALTLTEAQRATVRAAADIILPADDTAPAAGTLGVDEFVDEWVSAPYEQMQNDRVLIMSGLAWIDRDSKKRFDKNFVDLDETQKRAIFDDIAFRDRVKEGYEQPAAFFGRLRGLTLAAFYTSPEGVKDIGYIGNTPMVGRYPGPSAEAMTHLRGKLEELGLPFPD